MLVRVNIQTEFLRDTFVFPIRSPDATGKSLLDRIKERYDEWHSFCVHEFQFQQPYFDADEVSKPLVELLDIEDFKTQHEVSMDVVESPESIARREEEAKQLEQEMLRRQEEARVREEARQRRVAEVKVLGECWELEGYSNYIDVPLEENGKVVLNKGSLDQWCCVRYLHLIPESYEIFYFSVLIEDVPQTANTWKICVGVVPMQFRPAADRHWIGAQHSWSYIAGTGGKCYNSGKSLSYGAKYDQGDEIGVLVNFRERTLEFFKNGTGQGIAFRNIRGPVYPAVSLTAKACRVRLVADNYPPSCQAIMLRNAETERAKRQRWMSVTTSEFQEKQESRFERDNENSWSASFSYCRDEAMYYPDIGPHLISVMNQGSDDKWRVARSVCSYSGGLKGFEVLLLRDTKSSNTWRMCIGVVPPDFSSTHDRIWVGSQQSYSYIAGTGGKCHNCGQSTAYGDRFSEGDRVQVVMNFDDRTIEFFKNSESQGIAFEGIDSVYYAAVSMTADNGMVQINSLSDETIFSLAEQGRIHRKKLQDVSTKYGNVWENTQKSDGIELERDNSVAVCGREGTSWSTVCSFMPYQSGRRYFEVEVGCMGSNDPSIGRVFCVGVVCKLFDPAKGECFLGSNNSWGYASDGSKRANNQSSKYGSKYSAGDRIGVLMDFDNRILEFFLNGKPQGEAFDDLFGPVCSGVSMYGFGASAVLDGKIEEEKMNDLFLFS